MVKVRRKILKVLRKRKMGMVERRRASLPKIF
jgi:hypothetical protein